MRGRGDGQSLLDAKRPRFAQRTLQNAFSKVSWPILVYSSLRLTAGAVGAGAAPNTSATRSRSNRFQSGNVAEMNFVLLSQLSDGAAHRLQGNLGLKGGAVLAL